MIKIERGVAVPSSFGRRGRTPKYPWDDLEVGDSFLMPGVTFGSARSLARYQSQKSGRLFRAVKDGERIRVGRVG